MVLDWLNVEEVIAFAMDSLEVLPNLLELPVDVLGRFFHQLGECCGNLPFVSNGNDRLKSVGEEEMHQGKPLKVRGIAMGREQGTGEGYIPQQVPKTPRVIQQSPLLVLWNPLQCSTNSMMNPTR